MSRQVCRGDAGGAKKRVMFVDDEENVLSGIRMLLRRQRREWEMSFVHGGRSAMKQLENCPVDVIVSDMRMPDVDGLELLTWVKAQYPRTVRIILSGFTERAAALKLVPVAHQFLAKPCDADVLRRTVRNACELHSLINSERLGRMVGRLSHLPSAPEMYSRVLETTSQPDHCIRDLGALLAQDTGLTAKLLKLVNSAFFGQAKPTSDISRAVMLLGVSTVRELVLGLQAFRQFKIDRERCGIRVEAESRRSLAVGGLARDIALAEGLSGEEAGAALTAGLLHAVGRLVIAINDPDTSRNIVRMAKKLEQSRNALEISALGVSAAELGACLLAMWGIPYSIVEGVAYYPRPSQVGGDRFSIAGAVHIAHVLLAEPAKEVVEPDVEFGLARGLGESRDDWADRYRKLLEAA